jgi:hypothetical protein
MIGQRIESRPRFPYVAVFMLAVAGLCVVIDPAGNSLHLLIFAALPGAIGLALLIIRERGFEAEITKDGLEIGTPSLSLPYSAIEELLMPGKPGRARAEIQVFHATGVVRIPPRLNVRSDKLFDFLLSQLLPNDVRDLPSLLADYHDEQEQRFGPEHVFSYKARQHKAKASRNATLAIGAAGALVGAAWIAIGAILQKDFTAWCGAGFLTFLLSLLVIMIAHFGGQAPNVGKLKNSALVICPLGLALIQGDMRGELRWDELRDIRYRTKSPFVDFQLSGYQLRGIDLKVAGATITIADVYNRPLGMIHKRLMAYWQEDDFEA